MSQSYGGGLLSVAQVAKALGMPTRTVHRWIAADKIAATKLGPETSAYVITQAEVDRLLAERDDEPASA